MSMVARRTFFYVRQTRIPTLMAQEVDDYIDGFSGEVKDRLVQLRSLVGSLAPEAEESIAYGIPTFKIKKPLVHFAGYKAHIGFYPTPSVITAFEDKLQGYKRAKGSVQFPIDARFPIELIEEMIRFRLHQLKS